MRKLLFPLILFIVLTAAKTALAAPPALNGMDRMSIPIRGFGQNVQSLDFILRMPDGWKERPTRPVRLLFMSPYRHIDDNEKRLLADPEWCRFADQNQLALMTAEVHDLSTNINDRRNCYYYPQNYSGPAFLQAIGRFKQVYPLMDGGMLFHGVSAGAQWAHRLALWRPDLTLGVYCHVCSFYDVPSVFTHPGPAWLISTGYLDENSLVASKQFYRSLSAAGVPAILKIYPTIGHKEYEPSEKLARAFFQWLLDSPVNGNPYLAAAAFSASGVFGHSLSNRFFSVAEAKTYFNDGWFCPLLNVNFANQWREN